ncbi:unnamed protein product [Clavelina lepadiformis]|uniref:Uncharacterized protein n=1 Tax=Clavelina lepadiformis TaxID=159417 RepID=A0ABP0G2N4_CLALP
MTPMAWMSTHQLPRNRKRTENASILGQEKSFTRSAATAVPILTSLAWSSKVSQKRVIISHNRDNAERTEH